MRTLGRCLDLDCLDARCIVKNVVLQDVTCPKCGEEVDVEVDEKNVAEQLNLIHPDDLDAAATDAGFVHEDQAIDEVEIPKSVWVQLWRDGLISCSSHVTVRDFLEMYA